MTRFEEFKAAARSDIPSYSKRLTDEGVWDFKTATKLLQEFQNKLSYRLMKHLFGDHLGPHLWEDFRSNNQGQVLNWFNCLNEEFYIFVLHEIKTNKSLYAYC